VMNEEVLPRVLIIDDLFGRSLPHSRNEERANLCGQYLLQDCTGDEVGKGAPQRIKKPVADAVFHRGQMPACSPVGDIVDNDLSGTLQFVQDGWNRPDCPCWSLVLLDLCFYTGEVTPASNAKVCGMPEGREGDDDPRRYFGLRILEALHESFPDLPVIILSSKPRAEVSREFTVHDALGFLERDAQDSPTLLREYLHRHGLIPDPSGQMVGRSLALLKALRTARRVSQTRQNILIRGERGTGKELIAKFLHKQSEAGAERPMVVVDSGSLSPELYASTLFGHRKGAFTGASENRSGCIQEANDGDLFLDEIGNMPAPVQRGLLRVLEYRRVQPLGASAADSREVDVRFLSATNVDIDAIASTGAFREDLYDRLRAGGVLFLPPLRDRKEDIPLLAETFVREAEAQTPSALRRQIETEAMKLLVGHDWPGNVRQLRNCIFNAVAHHPDVEHLQPVHLDLPSSRRSVDSRPAQIEKPPPPNSTLGAMPLDELMAVLDKVRFEVIRPSQYAGKLRQLEAAWARFMARYLKAGLEATRKLTPKNPEGEVLPLPAVQLMTGNEEIKAWQAYDIIKAICQLSPEVTEELRKDPLLSDVYERAVRSRSGR